ncbi:MULTISPECIES: hypothetical protein [Halolamina]|uniref:Uncharacterized protein n=1 Tax=Halolamina pelagica TaxID=699431 RepID=A0A1I5S021_9EURY|nr:MULTISPECIES: hypothetical protein [Halolamina]NHX35428.1 hypothetical protein [Halolamina sp. R1-12]SFP64027.1 hypothetical protein SAMN05216277_105228 [Halolamina pelagica]
MQRSRERNTETEAEIAADADDETASSGGRLSGVRRRVGRLFSLRGFLLALATVVVGVVAGGAVGGIVPFMGTVGRVVGVVAATFLLGLVRSRRQYLEVGVAGAAVAAVLAVTQVFSGVFLPIGVEWLQQYGLALGAIGAGSGAVASLLGYYFGRDLRAGLTKSI